MIVIYSYGTIYKKDADTGVFQCPNCVGARVIFFLIVILGKSLPQMV